MFWDASSFGTLANTAKFLSQGTNQPSTINDRTRYVYQDFNAWRGQ